MTLLAKIAKAIVSLDYTTITYDHLTKETQHEYRSEAVDLVIALKSQNLKIIENATKD